MTFYADLHIHSKYSRATSRICDLEHMACWARKKGVSVLGTGDFTHPKWLDELKQKLVPAEPGLFRLRPDLEKQVDEWLDAPGGEPTRFMLQVEVSTIYKKAEQTRKIHHLIYAPDLEQAERFVDRLSRIGNLASDGRPILGLDSRHLLEITLESGEGCYLVPAHIWTPWFAVLGSKSGFDEIEHCYGDLTPEIFAVETGLSSDPPMNWRLSQLDRFTLVSNSDAHSPPKIGREACVFETHMDYFAMRRALKTGEGYGGTVEFFPEEGKYHLDGHRKCGVCLEPAETRQHDGRCPECGKPITLGVMHRVDELADRGEGTENSKRPCPFRSLVPLEELLAELQGVGPKSKAVQGKYEHLLARLGAELFILERAPLEDVQKAASSLLAEAISRMRQGRVIRRAGFDGEYGTIRLFEREELLQDSMVGLLFDMKPNDAASAAGRNSQQSRTVDERGATPQRENAARNVDRPQVKSRGIAHLAQQIQPSQSQKGPSRILNGLDSEQRRAAQITDGPLLILAGPGTGKTRTLTHRLAYLVADNRAAPEECLAITFTNRAAAEMRDRLQALLPVRTDRPPTMTFHALGLTILREHGPRLGLTQPVQVAAAAECVALIRETFRLSQRKAAKLLSRISETKRTEAAAISAHREHDPAGDLELAQVVERYRRALDHRGLVDFDDLVALPVKLLKTDGELVRAYRSRFRWIAVDEYQDIDRLQYELITLLAPSDGNLCVIGDPDQAIYGFRGGDVRYFQQFRHDFPAAQIVQLKHNYRSTRAIVDASLQLIAPASLVGGRSLLTAAGGPRRIQIHECTTERAEAEFVVHTIERMIGGSGFFFDGQRPRRDG